MTKNQKPTPDPLKRERYNDLKRDVAHGFKKKKPNIRGFRGKRQVSTLPNGLWARKRSMAGKLSLENGKRITGISEIETGCWHRKPLESRGRI